ncbi:MAG: hypothetical protein ACOYMS_03060, partial [Terrimicrobiaceae bacterium]
MKCPSAFLLLTLLACHFPMAGICAEDSPDEAPVTAARALKLGLDGLLESTDPSEAGQDRAAQLYAVAKRLETENLLAKRNLELVFTLDEWRDVLSGCRRGSCDLAYIVNGGGTMYSHGAARDIAEVEVFLAGLSRNLPLASGEGSARAKGKIDDSIAFLNALKPFDSGDAAADKEANSNLAAERERVIAHWEVLKSMISEIPAGQAEKIATFAV